MRRSSFFRSFSPIPKHLPPFLSLPLLSSLPFAFLSFLLFGSQPILPYFMFLLIPTTLRSSFCFLFVRSFRASFRFVSSPERQVSLFLSLSLRFLSFLSIAVLPLIIYSLVVLSQTVFVILIASFFGASREERTRRVALKLGSKLTK